MRGKVGAQLPVHNIYKDRRESEKADSVPKMQRHSQ
jgi:hypothetical protein